MASGERLTDRQPTPVDRVSELDIVAVLPPPTTGMTHVTACMIAAFSEKLATRTFMVARRSRDSNTLWLARKHITLIALTARATLARPARRPLYMVLDSGFGALSSLLMAALARVSRSPLIVHHHVFRYIATPTLLIRTFFRVAGPNARHIVLCSCMAEQMRQRYGAQLNVNELSNAAFVDPAISASDRGPLTRVGFLGNVTREKGVELFMQTVRDLSEMGVNVEADIAGPVRDPALFKEIAAFVAEDPQRRRALGPVYGTAKAAFFRDISVLLFPSIYANEAQPVTIYEALAAGVPVLATDRGCIPEQLPKPWVHSESDYVSRTCNVLSQWIDEPQVFCAEAMRALAMWNSALLRSRVELESVINAAQDMVDWQRL